MIISLAAKGWIKTLLLSHGYRLAESTDSQLIVRLLKRLSPVSTEHDLRRFGGEGDGGYLLPDDVDGIEACYSPGVGGSSAFELELAELGLDCFLCDHTVDGPSVEHRRFHFDRKFLGSVDNGSNQTLASWVGRYGPESGDLMLQMDIEGAEYDVVLCTDPGLLRRFRILVVEFHGLDAMFDPAGFRLIRLSFERLLDDFDVVHMHPNNHLPPVSVNGIVIPPLIEITFLRKDRSKTRAPARVFPHALDRSSDPLSLDFPLPPAWIG